MAAEEWDRPVQCPACGETAQPGDSRCEICGEPLTGGSAEPPFHGGRRDGPAGKVDPNYVRGELVKVAFAHNQAEAELIQGILMQEGVPSVVRRSFGFDVPDFLAAGPRDILVPQSAAEFARELLRDDTLNDAKAES